ncbi:hypothetical protein HRR83_000370 [Exophiala dermatitidis]|uniref:Uncharacterized protein n=1 Tax=Exophiala dermatitidis TaxID=5970 RepID=A0AAN6IY71_EXODE|nr:hypothetical protein HRR75_000334 [Exophiala dermatitidis]KAJ4527618.1 hypothetical protein HRR74_000372 [Exophiala dermatitidis]KAJ4528254.1 hypothetical protein HRR73_000876 [Exophiala dermatitidis]KAJ4531194.1 hypothetical protein HRR76_008868 [Exophiala dermatitidis]KAJ4536200.1 hypothetical protein HRR78_008639 [Exophiala dermatitidis]
MTQLAGSTMKKHKDNLLENLPATAKFYALEADGAISLGDAWMSQSSTKYHHRLPTAARAALALSELCVEKGHGKVFILLPHPATRRAKDGSTFPGQQAVKAVPELFYLPGHWSEADRTEWLSSTPLQRLHRLTSRYGWVNDEVPVLPFSIEVQEKQRAERPELSGFTQAIVTVYLSPQPYVGYTADMRAYCVREFTTLTGKQADRDLPYSTKFTCNWGAGWATFDAFRVTGGQGILDTLERWYRNPVPGKEECLTTVGVLRSRLRLAARDAQAARAARDAAASAVADEEEEDEVQTIHD